MNKKLSITQYYISWFLKKYHEIQEYKQKQDLYRIVDIVKDKSGNYSLKVQTTGKSIFFTCTPSDVVTNDQLMEGFSKKDIRTIVYYAANEHKKPKYNLLVHEFCSSINKMIFKFIHRGTNKEIKKTADQISVDKELLNTLKPEHAHLVGFTTASEQIDRDKKDMENLKNKIKPDIITFKAILKSNESIKR